MGPSSKRSPTPTQDVVPVFAAAVSASPAASSSPIAPHPVPNAPFNRVLQLVDDTAVNQGSMLDQESLDQPYDTLVPLKPRESRGRVLGLTLLTVGCLAAVILGIRIELSRTKAQEASLASPSARFQQQSVPLTSISKELEATSPSDTSAGVTVNGQLSVANSLILEPSSKPDATSAGQLYYDQATNQLEYYNGSVFVALQGGGNTYVTNVLGGAATASSATAGTLAMFTTPNSLGSSLLTENGSSVSAAGVLIASALQGDGSGVTNVNATTLQGSNAAYFTNASNLSSGTIADARLSNDVALLNASNTFQDSSNSTAAFQVDNASGINEVNIDTTANTITLGSKNGTPSAMTIQGGAAVGSNLVGADLNIDASDGTGVGGSGNINFSTGGGVANPLVTLDHTAGDQESSTTTPVSWPFTTGAESNMVLIVAVDTSFSSSPGATTTGVTYDGIALTKLVGLTGALANGSVWYLANPPSGSHTITPTYANTANATSVSIEATTFYNVNTANPIAGYTSQSQTATNISGTLTGTNAGEGVFDAVMSRGNWGFPTPGPSQTQLYIQSTFGRNTGSFRQEGAVGSTTMSWTGQGSSTINQVIVAFNPEPNLTPDPLSQTLSITQSNTLGIDLGSTENAANTISFGGGADRSIAVDQNPGSGAGHILTIQAGAGSVGNNNGGNLVLQGGAATGTGTGGSVIIKPQADLTAVFQVQNASGTALLTADTTNMKITITNIVVSSSITVDGHIVTGGSAPTIAAGAAACISPVVRISGDDTSGLITVTTGSAGCTSVGVLATVTFAGAFSSAPHVTLTPGTAGSAAIQGYVDVPTIAPSSFNLDVGITPVTSTTYYWEYWVAQ